MKIREFGVEIWMNRYETTCRYNLAETCVASLTLQELVSLSGRNEDVLNDILPLKLTYGAIEGSDRLRANICELYENQKPRNIIATHGTISANALIYETLVSPGDHVISVLPTYQQHYSIPESLGAEVSILPLREQNAFLPDPDELRALMRPDTRLIAINNPNNPTGALMDAKALAEIAEIARRSGAYVLCDEVYRGTDQDGDGFTASIADLYEKGISTAGLSKTFSLAGLRLGWIAAPVEVIKEVSIHRDYNTISVGMLNDHFGCMALEAKDKILTRSRHITRTNLAILDDWVQDQSGVSYLKPRSATVALLKYDLGIPSETLCIDLLDQTGVMFTPGSALDMEGYLRIGYANDTETLKAGLSLTGTYLDARMHA